MSNLAAASAALTEHFALHLELVMSSVFVDILWTKSYSMWHAQIERLEKGTAYVPQEYQELNILQLRSPDVPSVSYAASQLPEGPQDTQLVFTGVLA